MDFKGIILDIDDTIYDYASAHKNAYEHLITSVEKETGKKVDDIKIAYEASRKQIHADLPEMASSHNRLLYIQRMLEHLNVNSMNLSLKFYNTYWDNFIQNMTLFDGVEEFLEFNKHKKICLLTDLTAHIQHRKIEMLNLHKYADYLVTSEEVGIEKPHPYMFMSALNKMGLMAHEVIMVGDSYKKDILGAKRQGIQAFWFNSNGGVNAPECDNIFEFNSFTKLNEVLNG